MSLEKQYAIEGGILKQFFYNHSHESIILNQVSGILSTLDIPAEKYTEEDEQEYGQQQQ